MEGRISSRVLKPPGGAHTDIFAAQEPQEAPRKPVGNKTEISECFVINSDVEKPVLKDNDKQENNHTEANGNQVDKGDQVENENAKPAEEQKTAPAARVRVPPGGFSSGFW